MNNTLFTILFIILAGTSCHLSKTAASGAAPEAEPEWVPWEIKYERGPCFGECPVYVFYLLADHHGLVESRYNLLEPGWYEADLDQEAVHQILMDIEPETWWNEDISDLPEIADLPAMSILYKHKDGLRWYSVRGKISNQVADVQQKIEHLVHEARWKITTRRPLNPDVPEPTDVIVQLREGVDIQAWMKKYERFGIRLEKRIAPHQQYYLVSKVPGMGDANDFLQYIKHDEEVINAQWDHALSPRK